MMDVVVDELCDFLSLLMAQMTACSSAPCTDHILAVHALKARTALLDHPPYTHRPSQCRHSTGHLSNALRLSRLAMFCLQS